MLTLLLLLCSDDRSAEVFQKRIDTATQMKSVLGVGERPNCLIIDEIDGAPAVRCLTTTLILNILFNEYVSVQKKRINLIFVNQQLMRL